MIPVVDLSWTAKPGRRELVEPELNARRKQLDAPWLVHGHVCRKEGGRRLAVRVEHPRWRVVGPVPVPVAYAHPVHILFDSSFVCGS